MNWQQIKEGWRTLAKGSWVLHMVILLLLTIGVFFIYSATFVSEDVEMRPLYLRQLAWVGIGLFLYVAVALLDYRQWKRWQWGIYGATLLLLVLVLFMGHTIYGARRWIMLIGGIGIQPAEFAKLSTIILLAGRLSEPGRNKRRPYELLLTLLWVALPTALILQQPDLGTAMVFVPTAFVIMFIAGVPFRYIGGLAGIGVLLVLLLLAALFLPARLGLSEPWQERIAGATGLSEYQQARIEVFVNPAADPLGAGWNRRQSEIAVGSGGFWGKGYLQGTQNVLGYLPRSVAPTDFIYSVIAEERGFVGSVTVLVLFFLLFCAGLLTAARILDSHGRLLCVGIMSLLFFHVFINIAMTVGLMPITGLPLPLLSYGGSFMMVTMAGLGIVQSVCIRSDRRESYR